jgi:hypothetical protein
MNILLDDLPETIIIEGVKYPINYDFKSCVKSIMAWEDKDLTGYEKQLITVENLYRVIPENLDLATKEAVNFLNGGEFNEGEKSEKELRFYSFTKDANFIYAAIKQTHGIDLTSENIHWWKFIALFMDIGSETTFCGLTGLRKRVKTGKASKEELEMALEMGSIFDIPDIDKRTPEEKRRSNEFRSKLKRKVLSGAS